MKYFCDTKRHVVCVPFSVDNLHKMADNLNLKPCWFHPGVHPHYDMPKRRIEEITSKCTVVSTRTIYNIIRGNYHGLDLDCDS